MTIINSKSLKTWVEIDKRAIAHNYRALRSVILPETKFMAVVKSNAYGHGLVPYAREMQKLGADWFGVDDIDEALTLRKNGIRKPILVFGYIPESRLREAVKNNISITVSNFETFRKLEKLKGKIKIHLKVDTGLGRQGFRLDQVHPPSSKTSAGHSKIIKFLKQHENIKLEGLYTHFAGIESKKFLSYTKKQIREFNIWRNVLKENSFSPIVHASPSAGALMHAEYRYDMVRSGISIYGLWPSEEVRKILEGKGLRLKPALSWKTVVAEVKKLPKGSPIGYDLTERLKKSSTVVVLPVGYWHGLPRSLSGRGEIAIRGKKVGILGRVSMDMIVVDVTAIPGVRAGDEVILIGPGMPAEEVAEKANSINYEIVTRINPEIPRIYK